MDHKDKNSYFANSDGLLMLPYYLFPISYLSWLTYNVTFDIEK